MGLRKTPFRVSREYLWCSSPLPRALRWRFPQPHLLSRKQPPRHLATLSRRSRRRVHRADLDRRTSYPRTRKDHPVLRTERPRQCRLFPRLPPPLNLSILRRQCLPLQTCLATDERFHHHHHLHHHHHFPRLFLLHHHHLLRIPRLLHLDLDRRRLLHLLLLLLLLLLQSIPRRRHLSLSALCF